MMHIFTHQCQPVIRIASWETHIIITPLIYSRHVMMGKVDPTLPFSVGSFVLFVLFHPKKYNWLSDQATLSSWIVAVPSATDPLDCNLIWLMGSLSMCHT